MAFSAITGRPRHVRYRLSFFCRCRHAAPPGLRYVCDDKPAIRRRRAGKGFVYLDSKGRRVGDPAILKRIRSLAIPPAWTNVWICPSAQGHIQATGRDAKGRKQYRYHADYREAREEAKFEHIVQFAKALPAIRATVAEHMRRAGCRSKAIISSAISCTAPRTRTNIRCCALPMLM